MTSHPIAYPTSSLLNELSSGENLARAIAALRAAQAQAPHNLVVASRLAGNLERAGRYVEALEIYVHFANAWPRVFEMRYRLAATLGMSESWLRSDMSSEDLYQALEALEARGRLGPLLVADSDRQPPDLRHVALVAALSEWRELHRFLRWRSSAKRFVEGLVGRTHRDASYQRKFVANNRRDRVLTVRYAMWTTEVQARRLGIEEGVRTRPRRLPRPDAMRRRLSPVAYNAACYASRRYHERGDSGSVKAATAYLSIVLNRPDYGRWLTNIATDPDFDPIRKHPVFVAWLRTHQVHTDASRPSNAD